MGEGVSQGSGRLWWLGAELSQIFSARPVLVLSRVASLAGLALFRTVIEVRGKEPQ